MLPTAELKGKCLVPEAQPRSQVNTETCFHRTKETSVDKGCHSFKFSGCEKQGLGQGGIAGKRKGLGSVVIGLRWESCSTVLTAV